MSWPDKTVQPQVRRIKDSLDGGDNGHMIAEDRKILDPLRSRPQQGDRRRGGCRLKADREEDYLAVGVLAGQLEGIERRIDKTHICPFGFSIEQTAF